MSDPVRPGQCGPHQGLLAGFKRSLVMASLAVSTLLSGASLTPNIAHARSDTELIGSGDNAVRLAELPVEAVDTYQRILTGGPFRFPSKDGSVFGNRERQLPRQTRGYYREYTVPTSASRDRGARRIVCGGREPQTPDVCYYTQDHYASFRRIAP